jgi:hypothetical protein
MKNSLKKLDLFLGNQIFKLRIFIKNFSFKNKLEKELEILEKIGKKLDQLNKDLKNLVK